MLLDPSRSTQILTGADALLPTQTDTILHATDPGAAGSLPMASGLLTTSDGDTNGPVGLANEAVLGLHAQLEALADSNGLIGTVHGLTNLGETIGLGEIGNANLLTTALQTPTMLTSGDTSGLGQLQPEATAIDGAANALAEGALGDAGANPGLVPAGALQDAQAVNSTPLISLANDTVLTVHGTLESAADTSGLIGTIHGLTNLGETIGLGKIGESNLLTDALDTPQALLDGDTSPVTHLPTDVGNIVDAAQNLVSGAASDIGSGAFLSDPVGNALDFVTSLTSFPATSIANDAVNSIHATLEAAIDPLAPDTIHGVISLGNSAGLGEIGGSNLLTDTLATPGALLGGNTTPLTHLPADVGMIGSATSALPGDVAQDLGQSGLVNALTHPTTGAGALGGDLPGGGVTSAVGSTVSSLVDGATSAAALGTVGQAVTTAVDGTQSGLLHNVAQVPSDILGGVSAGTDPLSGDAGSTLGSAGGILGSVSGAATQALGAADVGGAASPVASTLSGPLTYATQLAGTAVETTASTASGLTTPVTSGNPAAPVAGALASALDSTAHAAGGTADPIVSSVSGVTAAAESGGAGGLASAVTGLAAGSAGSLAPTIAHAAILPDSIAVPPAAGGGLDALSGIASAASPATAPVASAAAPAGIDLGVAHLDVPVAAAHAEPLAALAHAA